MCGTRSENHSDRVCLCTVSEVLPSRRRQLGQAADRCRYLLHRVGLRCLSDTYIVIITQDKITFYKAPVTSDSDFTVDSMPGIWL